MITIIGSWPIIIWKALEEEGKNPGEVFQAAGVDYKKIREPGTRYHQQAITKLWKEAERISSAESFGLSAANQWHPTVFHAIGIAWFASASLKDALERLARNTDMLTTTLKAYLVKEGDRYRFYFGIADVIKSEKISLSELNEQGFIAGVGCIYNMCKTSLGGDFKPLEVGFPFSKPNYHRTLEQYFNCKVSYNHKNVEVIFDEASVEKQLATENLEILATSEEMIANYMAKMNRDDVVSQARMQIMQQLPSGKTSEESVANALNMSLRTLQRKLAEKKLTYRNLLDSVRKELADKYVADPRYSITEIAYLLGFAEPSSFARTYKRWTGTSPSNQRAAQREG